MVWCSRHRGGSRIFRTLVKNFVAEHWRGGGGGGALGGGGGGGGGPSKLIFFICVLFTKKCNLKNCFFAKCQTDIQLSSRNRLTRSQGWLDVLKIVIYRIFFPLTLMVKTFCNIVIQFKTFDWLLSRKRISTFNSLPLWVSFVAETCAMNNYSQWQHDPFYLLYTLL
jgi:hypothetical protein